MNKIALLIASAAFLCIFGIQSIVFCRQQPEIKQTRFIHKADLVKLGPQPEPPDRTVKAPGK